MNRASAAGAFLIVIWVVAVGCMPAPSPTSEPSLAPPIGTVRDGMFSLTIRASQATYTAGEPIDVEATLAYLGPKARVGISGSGSGPVIFGIEQVDGRHRTDPFRTSDCRASDIDRDAPLRIPFSKSGGWSDNDPDRVWLEAFFRDPVFRLTAGAWRVVAWADFSVGGCGDQDHRLMASIRIAVRP